ncbi:hypothetical protein L1O03_03655 [Corynebacterium uropygiale]|uniref:SAV-6107-like HEPN domain-containing protein n=1 Tax=Corynebacterium uropygiale TaxID=1775911 RepID=A0A9X1U000_9CORY|nr:SAV_6107 family HEPN domain-containing protein [Corynebacterium uropygiale]MCF4006274.1 hypothetical protein [Corynebacterium uropygiale]
MKAHSLLEQAEAQREQGDYAHAFESAYQAALRTAGSRIEEAGLRRRRRVPSGAWQRLALIDERGAYWAEVFRRFSSTRQRLMAGVRGIDDPRRLDELLARVGEFLDECEGVDLQDAA